MSLRTSSRLVASCLLLLSPFLLKSTHAWSLPRSVAVATNIGAFVTAGFELAEDLDDIGHAHGTVLLLGSKICREIHALRKTVVRDKEYRKQSTRWSRLSQPLELLGRPMWQALTTRLSATTLAVGALLAAMVEVIEDSSPGGHHGAVLLAMNELIELAEEARILKGRLLIIARNTAFRLCLAAGAIVFAAVETLKGGRAVGTAHHGVLLLAIFKFLRVLGLLQEEVEEEELVRKPKHA